MTPFAIDLPLPPSKNAAHGYGRGRVYRSRAYTKWIEQADGIFMAHGFHRGRQKIDGKFSLKIYYSELRIGRLDPQNIIDCACDWLQHAGVIANDKHLERLKLEPGDIGNDVRLVIEALG